MSHCPTVAGPFRVGGLSGPHGKIHISVRSLKWAAWNSAVLSRAVHLRDRTEIWIFPCGRLSGPHGIMPHRFFQARPLMVRLESIGGLVQENRFRSSDS